MLVLHIEYKVVKSDEISEVVYVDKEIFSNFDIAFDHKDILTEFFSTHEDRT